VFCEELMNNGILSKETHDTVVRFAPPLIITEDELDVALSTIRTVFDVLPTTRRKAAGTTQQFAA
jgi:ornithine--oxo-acid transaminase